MMTKDNHIINVKAEKLSNYEIKDIQELFDKYPQFSSVKEEYLKNATPGIGIKKPIGKMKGHSYEENKIKDWIFENFGGKIVLLKESEVDGIRSPDYLWNGKFWGLKNVSTEKAADSALRCGLKQIFGNPGGIILDYEHNELDMNQAILVIILRTIRSAKRDLDIIIIKDDKLYDVIRFKK